MCFTFSRHSQAHPGTCNIRNTNKTQKQLISKIGVFKNSQESTCTEFPFFIKRMAGEMCNFILKKDYCKSAFLWILRNFQECHLYGTRLDDCFLKPWQWQDLWIHLNACAFNCYFCRALRLRCGRVAEYASTKTDDVAYILREIQQPHHLILYVINASF